MNPHKGRPIRMAGAYALGRRVLMAIPMVALVTLPLWSPRVAVGPQGALLQPDRSNFAVVLHWPSFILYLLFLVAVIGVMYFWLFVRPHTPHGLSHQVQVLESRLDNIEDAVTEPQSPPKPEDEDAGTW